MLSGGKITGWQLQRDRELQSFSCHIRGHWHSGCALSCPRGEANMESQVLCAPCREGKNLRGIRNCCMLIHKAQQFEDSCTIGVVQRRFPLLAHEFYVGSLCHQPADD